MKRYLLLGLFLIPIFSVFAETEAQFYRYIDLTQWDFQGEGSQALPIEPAVFIRQQKRRNPQLNRIDLVMDIVLPSESPLFGVQVGTFPGGWALTANQEQLAFSPQGWGRVVPLPLGENTLKLRWSVDVSSDFIHSDDSWENWRIGLYRDLQEDGSIEMAYRWLQGGMILVTSLLFLGLFFMRNKETGALYFALFAFFMAWKLLSNQEVFLPPVGVLLSNISPIVFLFINHAVNFVPLLAFIFFLKTQFPQGWIKGSSPFLMIAWVMIFLLEVFPFLLLGAGGNSLFYSIHTKGWSLVLEAYAMGTILFGVTVMIRGSRNNIRRTFLLIFSTMPIAILVPTINFLYHLNPHIYPSVWWGNATLFLVLAQGAGLVHQFVTAINFMEHYGRRMGRLNQGYDRFIPRHYLDLLGREDVSRIHLGDQCQSTMTVLFGDIKNFTALTESMSSGEVLQYVNHLYGRIGPIITQNGGYVDKYMGDGFLALFPGITSGAIHAAREIQEVIARVNRERAWQDLRFSMGIHGGSVMLGCVGEPDRMDITVIADTVNQAERLHRLSKNLGSAVVFSGALLDLVDPQDYRSLGLFKIKGKRTPLNVYHLISAEPPVLRDRYEHNKNLVEEGLTAYQEGQLDKSETLLKKALEENPNDGICQFFLSRIKDAQHNRPFRWDGVEVLE